MNRFFRTWLPQMIGYAETISAESEIREAWLHNDTRGTTIFYPGELFAQLFDEMTIDVMGDEIDRKLHQYDALRSAIQEFIKRVTELETWVNRQSPYPPGEDVLASSEWRMLRGSAGAVVVTARDAGFSADDFDPDETEFRGHNT